MHAFDFAATNDINQALRLATVDSAFLAGGTTLVDLMKLDVLTPKHVIDINALPMRGIGFDPDGFRIGAMERMADVAANQELAVNYPVIAKALLGASGQVRNMASLGGNLLQRTRCDYFRDVQTPCNKREPGSGCPALTGENRKHAVFGASSSCAATHASDLAVALVAMDASLTLRSRDGERGVKIADFYRLPENTPHLENQLRPGELITAITVPRLPWARRSTYVKIKDRQSFDFALTSAAVALDLRGRLVHDARVAVGGVATVPWRLPAVEDALKGLPAGRATFEAAAALAADGAQPLTQNGFKVTLVQRTIVRALLSLGGAL
jgi:xanthine dehydrogenase YagS FAD-binding subunit